FRRVLLGKPGLVRFAPLAGPEPGLLGVLASRMETNVLRPRQPSRARRTAIHPRGLDRIIKRAVSLGVTSDDRRPTGIIHRRGGESRVFHRCVHSSLPSTIHPTVRILSMTIVRRTPSLAFKFDLWRLF